MKTRKLEHILETLSVEMNKAETFLLNTEFEGILPENNSEQERSYVRGKYVGLMLAHSMLSSIGNNVSCCESEWVTTGSPRN